MPIHHIGLNVTDVDKARDFYLAALKPLGYKVKMSFFGKIFGMGPKFGGPEFWISSLDAPSADGSQMRHAFMGTDKEVPQQPREPTGKLHIAFQASTRQQVRDFHAAALAAGATCNGPPGPREEYFATYYGAFVLDLEGRNIEAVCLKPAFLAESWGAFQWSAVVTLIAVVGACAGKYFSYF